MKRYRIKELGDIVTGNTPSKKNLDYYNSEDIPFFKPDSLDENEVAYLTTAKEYLSSNAKSVARIVPRETVLFSCIGSIGKIGITNVDNSSFNQQINAIIPNKEIILPKYLCYALKYNKKKIQAIANAAVVPIINKTQFSEFEISIHQKEEQVKVVNILDQAQELIDKRKAQIEALDELIQSVFYDMFGDPRESINNNSINNKVSLLGDITNLITYGLTVRPNYTEVGIPLISAREIKSGKVDFSIAPFISTNDFDKLSDKAKARKNEILFSKTGSIGNCAIVETDFDFAVTQNVARISLIPSIVNTKWLLYYLRTNYIQILCNRLAKGNTVKDLQIQDMKKIPIFLPDIQLQNQFAEMVENIEKQKELLNESLVELENNFNSLMQRAFNGGSLR